LENKYLLTYELHATIFTVIGQPPPKANQLPLEIIIPAVIIGLIIIIIVVTIFVCRKRSQ
jgi:subtilase family serine protease